MPLPSTSVFHPRWASRVAPVNASSFNATVTITQPGEGGDEWPPSPTPGDPIVLYTGPARVTYAPSQGQEGDAAGQNVHSRRAVVTIPRDQPFPAGTNVNGALIHVDGLLSPNAPAGLLGRELYAESASWSSHTWETLFEAVDDQTNQREG